MSPDTQLVRAALDGQAPAIRRLVEHLTPVVHARVARVLLCRQAQAGGRDLRQDVEDHVQEVFCALFAKDAQTLRRWSPEGGASLRNFVGLVAERRTITGLRSARAKAWRAEPRSHIDLGRQEGHEARVTCRATLQRLLVLANARLSPQGRHLFDLLLLQQRPVAEVCTRANLSAAAVYAWRSRLSRMARGLRDELDLEGQSRLMAA